MKKWHNQLHQLHPCTLHALTIMYLLNEWPGMLVSTPQAMVGQSQS